jgi:hypothetical protein
MVEAFVYTKIAVHFAHIGWCIGTAGMFWSLFFAGVAALPSNATTIIQNFWETCILIFT